MPTLWIHMGTPKTGSTSLQAFFKENERLLLERNIYIPRTGRRHRNNTIRHDRAFLINNKAQLQCFIEEIKAWPGHDIIVTDEDITYGFHPLNSSHFATIKKECPDLDIRTITYIRRLDDNLKSAFNQRIKAFIKAPPDLELRKSVARQYDYNSYLHHLKQSKLSAFGVAKILAQSQKILGVENTIIRLFGKGFLLNDSIVDDFFNIMGIDPRNGFIPTKRRNVSPPMSVIPFFMSQGLPDGMKRKDRETLLELAEDTFRINNTVSDPSIRQALEEEIPKLSELHRRYTETQGKEAGAHTYTDLYQGKEINLDSADLECDRYILYLIRQQNYAYNELCILRKEIAGMKSVSLICWCKRLILFLAKNAHACAMRVKNKTASRR